MDYRKTIPRIEAESAEQYRAPLVILSTSINRMLPRYRKTIIKHNGAIRKAKVKI